jgi:Ca2+-binding EF-hand superfamily protein
MFVPRVVLAVAIVAVLAVGRVVAQSAPPPYDPRVAFRETDTNGDGEVDQAEFIERMTVVFFNADADKNGVLTTAESQATLVQTRNLDAADTNHDGVLTLHEFLRARERDYEQVDTNRNGELEIDEVVAAYEKGAPR